MPGLSSFFAGNGGFGSDSICGFAMQRALAISEPPRTTQASKLRMRLNLSAVTVLVVALNLTSMAQSPPARLARGLAQQAAAALGGEARLRNISRISVSGISVLYQREQSERPEGSWLPTFTEFTDVRDVTTSAARRIAGTRGVVVTQRVTFAGWLIEPEGIRFPRVWEYSTGGVVDGTVDLTRVRLTAAQASTEPEAPTDALDAAIASLPRVADIPLGDTRRVPEELAPEIVKVAANFDIVEVRQDDGLDPRRAFGMHYDVLPWQTVTESRNAKAYPVTG